MEPVDFSPDRFARGVGPDDVRPEKCFSVRGTDFDNRQRIVLVADAATECRDLKSAHGFPQRLIPFDLF
jgi:hypothetical protein